MKELKLKLESLEALETRLRELGAVPGPAQWVGNWYLETTPARVRKIAMQDDRYRYLELEKLETGFAFTKDEALEDVAALHLERTALHNVLHKTVRPWVIGGLGVDILLFEDIEPYFCVNYEDPHKQKALDFIRDGLGIATLLFLEVPFNVVKRRALGIGDFDEVSCNADVSNGSHIPLLLNR
jgi:hypothetical protein